MRYFNQINMGEGIAGTNAIGMSTTVIYSCMGIAFVNPGALRGGLYHYPSVTLGNANVAGTIRQMYNDIQPTAIMVTPAAGDGMGMTGSSSDDIDKVVAFLTQLGTVPQLAKAAKSAQLTWNGGVPVYNTPPGGLDVHDEDVGEAVRGKMTIAARELDGNVAYYGGDGETDGVLEQGLPKAKKAKQKMCVIL